MTAVKVLRAARAKIEKPEAWVQGYFSVERRTGERCFCADGALLEVRYDLRVGIVPANASFWLSQAARSLGFETASKLNDAPTTTHADVLALFDLAIRLADEGGAA